MTIQIKQLVIRAVVEPRREPAPAATAPRVRAPESARTAPSPTGAVADRDALVAECAREVLRELRRRRSR